MSFNDIHSSRVASHINSDITVTCSKLVHVTCETQIEIDYMTILYCCKITQIQEKVKQCHRT